jgi:hypothetical protein
VVTYLFGFTNQHYCICQVTHLALASLKNGAIRAPTSRGDKHKYKRSVIAGEIFKRNGHLSGRSHPSVKEPPKKREKDWPQRQTAAC